METAVWRLMSDRANEKKIYGRLVGFLAACFFLGCGYIPFLADLPAKGDNISPVMAETLMSDTSSASPRSVPGFDGILRGIAFPSATVNCELPMRLGRHAGATGELEPSGRDFAQRPCSDRNYRSDIRRPQTQLYMPWEGEPSGFANRDVDDSLDSSDRFQVHWKRHHFGDFRLKTKFNHRQVGHPPEVHFHTGNSGQQGEPTEELKSAEEGLDLMLQASGVLRKTSYPACR